MTFALVRSLLLAEAATPSAIGEALLLAATRGASIVRALNAIGAIEPLRLEQQLERGDAPAMRQVIPVAALVQNLPPGLCERLLAVPVRRDPRTGTVDVAVVDARDEHAAQEIGFWLHAPVRLVRTSLASMDAALRGLHPGFEERMVPLAAPINQPGSKDGTGSGPVSEEPGTGRNIPFSLTRKNLMTVNVGELGPPVIEHDARPRRSEPVLDLKRRKPPGEQTPESLRGVPTTRRGPYFRSAAPPPVPSAATLVEHMRATRNRDRILQFLLDGVRTAAGSVTVFAVRRDMVAGWLSSPDLGKTVRDLRIAISASPLLDEALSNEGVVLARVPGDASHAALAAVLGPAATGEIALTALRVDGKPAALVVAGGLKDRSSSMLILGQYALAAGEALASLLRDNRK